ncbi:MAG: Macrolide export protein MacA [Planctomycetota bacterium]|jgi:RND family efflux transporter MFP subunit
MVRVLIPTLFSLALPFAAAAQDGAPQGPPPTPVKVAEARKESLAPRRKVFGELRAHRRSTVAAEEGGIVLELLVHEGARVRAGAPIARLDGTRLELELGILGANAAVARATLVERELGRARSERDLELLKRAAAQGGTNPRELANAESDLAVAAALVTQAKAQVAVLEQQSALLSERRKDLEIVAPFDGVVTKRHAEAGAWIASGGAVVELVDSDHLEAWFDVPQEMFAVAQRLARSDSEGGAPELRTLEIQATTGVGVVATGLRIVPEIDAQARTFHAIATVRDDPENLAAGLALNAFVPQGPSSNWTVVPKDAIVYQGTNTIVFVVRNGVAVLTPVRVAFPIGDEVALEPGEVDAGAMVVVEGNERLIPRSKVAPIEAKSDAKGAAARPEAGR